MEGGRETGHNQKQFVLQPWYPTVPGWTETLYFDRVTLLYLDGLRHHLYFDPVTLLYMDGLTANGNKGK